MTETITRRDTGRGASTGPASGLVALLGALFLGNVDIAVANIAGPSIRSGLHASAGELTMIVSGYTLVYAIALVSCARLGAERGYRPMFLAGLTGFIFASLLCGLAPDAGVLIAARILAGITAALMSAQVLTGIQTGFHGPARVRALGMYSVALSAGAVAGQALGGLLISANLAGTTWRPVFLVNVPTGVVLLWLAWRRLPAADQHAADQHAADRHAARQRTDIRGTAALLATLLLLVIPLVFGPGSGWPAWSLVSLAASAPAFVVLWLTETRVARAGGRPLVDTELLARPAVGWGLAAQSAATGTYFGILFTLALYLQSGLGKSAAYSGLALVAWVAAFGVPGPLLSRLTDRNRARIAPVGSVLLAGAYAAIAVTLLAGQTSGALLICLLGVAGLGLGAGFTGMLGHLTATAGTERAADLSGLFNTGTRVGGVIGTAVFGAVYLALARHPVHGFAILNIVLAATALAAAAMAAVSVRSPRL